MKIIIIDRFIQVSKKFQDGFILSDFKLLEREPSIRNSLPNQENATMIEPDGYARTRKFSLVYKVETITDGNGTIKPSVTETKRNAVVTYELLANEGYKVAYIKVTDAEGNEIIYEGNKFTIENPVTGTKIGLITTGILVSCVVILSLVINRKKKDKLFNV